MSRSVCTLRVHGTICNGTLAAKALLNTYGRTRVCIVRNMDVFDGENGNEE